MSDFIRAGTELTALQVVLDLGSDATWSDVCAHAAEAVEERNRLRADLARVTAERDAAVRTAERIDNKWHDAIEQRDAARARVRELLKVARAAVALSQALPKCEERLGDSRCEARASWVDRDGRQQCDAHHAKPRTHPLQWSDEADALAGTVDALPPSMLEEPSDG